MKFFSFNPPINLFEEGKWLLALTSFEATNSVFNETDENNSFSIGTPGYCRIPNSLPDGNFDNLKQILDLRSENEIEIYGKGVEKRRTGKKEKAVVII